MGDYEIEVSNLDTALGLDIGGIVDVQSWRLNHGDTQTRMRPPLDLRVKGYDMMDGSVSGAPLFSCAATLVLTK